MNLILPLLALASLAAPPAQEAPLAEEPAAEAPVPESLSAVTGVSEYAWFAIPAPETYRMRGDHPEITRGVILRLEVEPGFARARQVDQPVLYVGPYPARRVNPSEDGTCLVVWAPLDASLEQTVVFFGSRTLPERVDAERGKAEVAAAIAAGATPLLPQLDQSAAPMNDLEAVRRTAARMAERCPEPDQAAP